jgi:hypothetical protein
LAVKITHKFLFREPVNLRYLGKCQYCRLRYSAYRLLGFGRKNHPTFPFPGTRKSTVSGGSVSTANIISLLCFRFLRLLLYRFTRNFHQTQQFPHISIYNYVSIFHFRVHLDDHDHAVRPRSRQVDRAKKFVTQNIFLSISDLVTFQGRETRTATQSVEPERHWEFDP